MIEMHEDYLTGKIKEVEIEDGETIKTPEKSKVIIDRAEYTGDWVKGYLNGELVITLGGVLDISSIELFDANGNKVLPTPAPPSDTTRLQLAMAEMIEMSIQPALSGVGGIFDSGRELHHGSQDAATSIWEITPTYAIVDLYAALIDQGLRALDAIPERFRDGVRELLADKV